MTIRHERAFRENLALDVRHVDLHHSRADKTPGLLDRRRIEDPRNVGPPPHRVLHPRPPRLRGNKILPVVEHAAHQRIGLVEIARPNAQARRIHHEGKIDARRARDKCQVGIQRGRVAAGRGQRLAHHGLMRHHVGNRAHVSQGSLEVADKTVQPLSGLPLRAVNLVPGLALQPDAGQPPCPRAEDQQGRQNGRLESPKTSQLHDPRLLKAPGHRRESARPHFSADLCHMLPGLASNATAPSARPVRLPCAPAP